MNSFKFVSFALAAFLVFAGIAGSDILVPSADDSARVDGLPVVGKWMVTKQGTPADWLKQKYKGRILYEPVNVIIVDRFAASSEEAKARMYRAARKAGFPAHYGHSGGYQARIGGALCGQLPEQRRCAFADGEFEMNNSHGRIFGPHFAGGVYYFTAAFSYEKVRPLHKEIHRFGSFVKAREKFVKGLCERAGYRFVSDVPLGNALEGPQFTTGDHDGLAAVVEAGERE